jgi:hypothetical protein
MNELSRLAEKEQLLSKILLAAFDLSNMLAAIAPRSLLAARTTTAWSTTAASPAATATRSAGDRLRDRGVAQFVG